MPAFDSIIRQIRNWEYASPEERKQYQQKPPAPPQPPPEDYATQLHRSVGEGLASIGVDPSILGPSPQATQQQPRAAAPGPNDYRLPALDAPGWHPKQDDGGFLGRLKDVGSDIGSTLYDASPTGMLTSLRDPGRALADARDTAGSVAGFGSQFIGKPAFGILGSALEPGMRADQRTGEHAGFLEQISDPGAYLRGVGTGILHPQRAADEMDLRSRDYSGVGDVLAATAEQPLSYVGGVGTPVARSTVGQALGGLAGSDAAKGAGLSPGWQQAAGLAGSVVGGGVGAMASPEAVARGVSRAGEELTTGRLAGERGSFDPNQIGKTTPDGVPPLHEPAPLGGPGAVVPPAPAAAGSADVAETILGLPKPTATPLTKTDVVLNRIKDTLGMSPSNDIAKTAIDYRKTTLPVVESQANRLSTQVDEAVRRVFNIGKDGRVEDVVGRPFIQDIAARLPEFRQYLTPEQVAAMEEVRANLAPFKAVLDRAGIAPSARSDVMDGGFYMPRGRADLEGADAAVKVGSGRGGGKAGFEKHATFDSMAQGADAGYEYAPLAEAVNSYAKDAGQRAVDTHVADYFKQARDEAGKLIGETPADRMDQVIKGQWEDVNNRLLSVRERLATAEKRAGVATGRGDELAAVLEKQATGASIPLDASAAVERDINRFITRAQQRITALRQKGGAYAEQADNLEHDLAAVKDERAALAPDYKASLEEARATPRTQSTIALPRSAALNGWTFPDQVASAMQSAINDEKGIMGRGSKPTKVVMAYNNIVRGLKATGDISFTGIQGLIGAARDPRGYGKAMAVAMKSMANPKALGAYLNDMDAQYAAAGKMSIAEKVKNGLHIGGADTEYSIKTGLSAKIDALTTGGKINPFRGANRSFGYFGDVMRNELSDMALENAQRHGFDMADPANLRSAMDVANRATGWSPNTFGGDLGQLGMFAPRFFQSQLEYLATAAQGGTIGGMEARRGLVRLLGLSVGLTVLGNEATERAIPYEELFNPNSPNFMRFRFKGQDISILGPWDSLARSAVSLSPISLDRDYSPQAPDASYFLRTKASPAVGMAWDLLSGKTFTGEDARTPGNIATQLVVPFSLQDVTNQNPLQTAVGATGLKSTPETPTEQLNGLSRAKFGGTDYKDLLTSQQKQIQAEHPDTFARYQEHQSADTQKYNEQKAVYAKQQAASEAALFAKELTPYQLKNLEDTRRDKLEGAGTAIYGDKIVANPTNWKQRYGNILQQNTKPTGAVNWDAVDSAVASLSAADQAAIEDNRGSKGTPLQQLRKQISAEYNALPIYRGYTPQQGRAIDQLVTDSRALAKGGRTQAPSDVQVLQALRKVAQQQNVDLTSPAYIAARRSVLGIIQHDPARATYRARHPEEALLNGNAVLTPLQLAAIKKRMGAVQ